MGLVWLDGAVELTYLSLHECDSFADLHVSLRKGHRGRRLGVHWVVVDPK